MQGPDPRAAFAFCRGLAAFPTILLGTRIESRCPITTHTTIPPSSHDRFVAVSKPLDPRGHARTRTHRRIAARPACCIRSASQSGTRAGVTRISLPKTQMKRSLVQAGGLAGLALLAVGSRVADAFVLPPPLRAPPAAAASPLVVLHGQAHLGSSSSGSGSPGSVLRRPRSRSVLLHPRHSQRIRPGESGLVRGSRQKGITNIPAACTCRSMATTPAI